MKRIVGKPFKKGNKGGPGRIPIGACSREMLRQHSPTVWARIIELALDDNVQAMRLFAERTEPSLSSVEISHNTKEPKRDVSGLTDEQLRAIAQKEAEIEAIMSGGPGIKTPNA